MAKTTVSTVFGKLTLPYLHYDQRLLAEQKGLKLLHSILEESKIWASAPSNAGKEFEIFSLDDGDEVSIFPLETIQKYHFHNDPHMEVTLNQEPVCILMQPGQECAVVDAVISFVLLGEAGWPPWQVTLLSDGTVLVTGVNHRQHAGASNRDGCFDVGMVFVTLHFNIVIGEVVNIHSLRIQFESRQS
jgi:hypothetical protein